MGDEVIGGYWRVVGVLRELKHEVNEQRFVASVEVPGGTLTLFINEKVGTIRNAVVDAARELIGMQVCAEGELSPWTGDWVRKPYWLSPNSVRPSK